MCSAWDAETSSFGAEPQATECTRPACPLSVDTTLRPSPDAAHSLMLPSAELLAADAEPPGGAAEMLLTWWHRQAMGLLTVHDRLPTPSHGLEHSASMVKLV